MNVSQQTVAVESGALGAKPPPMARPEGDRRVQAALDSDKLFRGCVLAAFVLAIIAGSGFGGLPRAGGWGTAAFGLVTAVGIASRCVGPQSVWRPVQGEADAKRGNGIRWAALIATRLATIAYAWCAWRGPGAGRIVEFIFAAAVILTLDALTVRRRHFAVIVAAVVLTHLCALPPSANLLQPALPLHLVTASLEMLLLTVAGFRFLLASLWQFPSATYRIAPLCIVPRLDRAWDHPVKINVA
jgi:hypothetical protein